MNKIFVTLVFILTIGTALAQPLNACYQKASDEAVPGTIAAITNVSSAMEENMIGQPVMVYYGITQDPDGSPTEVAFTPFLWGMEITGALVDGDIIAVRQDGNLFRAWGYHRRNDGTCSIIALGLSSPTPKDAFYRVSAEAGI